MASLGPTAQWSGSFRWNEPGIGYLILTGTVPPAHPHTDVCGTVWYPDLAWFSALDGYGYLLPRVPLEFRHTAWWVTPPASCTGIIIHAPAGVTGQVTAIKP